MTDANKTAQPPLLAKLASLELEGFKSICRLDPPLTFGQLNVLIGANGSGKSNLLSRYLEDDAGNLAAYLYLFREVQPP